MKGIAIKPDQRQRVIRVFISSTFQDMKEEREELVKRVFPQLRKICESRGVTWGEVDLRWGITDEQKAEGKVLPICLEEIQSCRPYFIGMLGDRYGWLPDEIPQELIEREPWLEEHKDKSVTELEILHGVLNDPEMAGHAYFYFRDPAYVESLSDDMHADYPEKLESLKDRIRKSGLPVSENYTNPKKLGELVLKDLTAVIDERFPEGTEPDPIDREAADHEAFAQAKHRIYIGRKEYFDRLDEHAKSDDQPLVVLGESGSGKSALLGNWALNYREGHPDDLHIMHFIGSTPYSSDWVAMLRRIMGEFKRRFDIQQDIPTEPDKLRSAFANWLHMASAAVEKEGAKILLILDALNQLEDRDQAPDLVWLPPFIPENIRLVLSTLPGRPLDDLKKREWPTMIVEPLIDDERKQLIIDYLAQYRKTLSEKRIEKIASADQTRNPLYLRTLLEELRIFGEHERLDERIDYYLEAKNVPELYEKIFERYEVDYERDRPDLISETMTLLWASRRGLSETELLDLLGTDGEPLPQAFWAPFFIAADKLFVSRSGLIGFSHDYQRQAIQDRYLQTEEDQNSAHLHLADYFVRHEINPRKVDELPWQLSEAQSWQRLFDLLADLYLFDAAWKKNQFDVKRYWVKIEDASSLRLVDAYGSVLDKPEEVTDFGILMNLAELLYDTGNLPQALSLHEMLEKRCRGTNELNNLSICLRNQGNVFYKRGDLDGAMARFKEAERIARELGDMISLHGFLGNQGLILYRRGDLDGAMALHKEHERICREFGDKVGLSRSLGNQGLALWQRGDLDAALALDKEQERICRELGDLNSLQQCLGNQGVILWQRNDLDGALELNKEQERICRELGDLDGLENTLGHQGLILWQRGDLDGAMILYKKQEHLCRELDDPIHLSASLCNQGIIFLKRGDLDSAMTLFKEQECICRKLDNPENIAISLANQGEVLKERGDLNKAMALFKEAERMFHELGRPDCIAACLANQADVLAQNGHPKEAISLVEEAYRLATDHGHQLVAENEIKPILDKIRAELAESSD